MKVRAATGRTALRARLTAAGCGALALLGTATLSACTSGGTTSTPPPVTSFTIAEPTGGSDASPSSAHTTVTVTPTHTMTTTVPPNGNTHPTATVSSPSPSPIPVQAPVTGGGGTAGFQDGLLLVLGAAAIVAGAGTFAYRKRLTRKR